MGNEIPFKVTECTMHKKLHYFCKTFYFQTIVCLLHCTGGKHIIKLIAQVRPFLFSIPWKTKLTVDTEEIDEAKGTPFPLFDMDILQSKGNLSERKKSCTAQKRNLKMS